MARPNLKKWTDRYIEAVVKNTPPGTEMDPTVDQFVAVVGGLVRQHIRKHYGDVVPLNVFKKRKAK